MSQQSTPLATDADRRAWIERFYASADRIGAGENPADMLAADGDPFAPDFCSHMSGMGDLDREAFLAMTQAFAAGFPGYRHTLVDCFGSGQQAAARVRWQGTHTGDFSGIPATGRSAGFEAINIFRFEDGRLAEHWVAFDQLALLQQLGVAPAPAGAPA